MSKGFGPSVRTRVLVREVMNSPVITAEPNESINVIADRMKETKAGSVVITNDGVPSGILTERDIVTKAVSKDLVPSTIRASEIMSSPLFTIESDKEIIEAAREMRKRGVKRLGVSYKKRLVGIISITDILAITPELLDIISEKALVISGGASIHSTYVAGYCDSCNQWSDNLLEIDSKFVCNECTTGKPAAEEEVTEVSSESSE